MERRRPSLASQASRLGSAFTATGWTVAAAPVSGATSLRSPAATGVLGKWKYLASHDVMLGLGDGFEGQVWVYKPTRLAGAVKRGRRSTPVS